LKKILLSYHVPQIMLMSKRQLDGREIHPFASYTGGLEFKSRTG